MSPNVLNFMSYVLATLATWLHVCFAATARWMQCPFWMRRRCQFAMRKNRVLYHWIHWIDVFYIKVSYD